MSDNGKGGSAKKKVVFSTLIIGVVLGVILWGAFNWGMEMTNQEDFCISCHEMRENVYEEYTDTIHYSNRTGVRATCPDCHVPKDWVHKIARKIQASNELYHHFMGTVDTPEKFEAKRFVMAGNVWRAMKSTDSRECRNCHGNEFMNFNKQEDRAIDAHERMEDSRLEAAELRKEGKLAEAEKLDLTCIDCHKGIAHSLPADYDPEKDIAGESPYYE